MNLLSIEVNDGARYRWNVQLEADCAAEPLRSEESGATIGRVELDFAGDRCTASFVVHGDDMVHATRAALAEWARVTETASLPRWPLVALHIERRDAPPVPARPGSGTTLRFPSATRPDTTRVERSCRHLTHI